MNLPTIRQLECLVAVADKLSFSQAAKVCFITQPALSAQIQQLEAVLGVQLFERDRRRVLPTSAGAAMAEKARGILADIHDLVEAAAAFKGLLTGILRLGVIPTLAPYILPAATKELHRRYPRLRLLLREGQTLELLRQLGDGSLDLVLLALEADLGDVETMPLLRDPFLLAVPADHSLAQRKRVSEKDLRNQQVLLLEDGHCLRDQALAICSSSGASELGDFRATSLTTLVQMVSGGVGVTLLPQVSVDIEAGPDRSLSLIPLSAKGASRTIGLAWRPASIRKAEFQLFGEAIKAAIE